MRTKIKGGWVVGHRDGRHTLDANRDPVGSTAQALLAAMRVDYDRHGALIKRLGMRAD